MRRFAQKSDYERWRAGYAERCKSGSGGGETETADASQYGADSPTSIETTLRKEPEELPLEIVVDECKKTRKHTQKEVIAEQASQKNFAGDGAH